ncbi:MAG: hypothetical protein ACR2PV_09235 [Gammaproteobacteria bacterium]
MKKLLCATTLSLALLSGTAQAQNMLANKIDGKLTLSGNVGYIYNFSGSWRSTESHTSKSGNSVGYGLSFGYDHKSGFGLSSEYLTYTHNYETGGASYKVPYHIATFTPSYRVNFGKDDNWYMKTGLGLGFSISSIEKTTTNGNIEIASGLLYYNRELEDGKLCHIANDHRDGGLFIERGHVVPVYAASEPDGSGNQRAFTESPFVGIEFEPDPSVGDTLPVGIACLTLWDGGTFTVLHEDGLHYAYGTYKIESDANNSPYPAEYAIDQTDGIITRETPPQSDGSNIVTIEFNDEEDIRTLAIDDAGFIIAPTLAFGYDDDIFHFDITTKYIHALKDVLYHGENGDPNQTQNKGPLAFYIGAGVGINF